MATLKISAVQFSNIHRPERRPRLLPGLSLPRGLAIYHGNLYVATNTVDPLTGNEQSSIVKVSASGVQTLFATLSTVNSAAEGLAIDGAGNVFVLAFDLTSPVLASSIFKFTPEGAESTFGSLPGQGFGLAFDAAGNLFAADAENQTIFKFTPAGASSVLSALQLSQASKIPSVSRLTGPGISW